MLVDGGGSVRNDSIQQARYQAPSSVAASPTTEAQRIVSQSDDKAKAESFAQTYNATPADQRSALVEAVFQQDSDALNTWLAPQQVNDLVKDGWLTDHERAGLAEAVATAFNDGSIQIEPAYGPYSTPTTTLPFDAIPVQNFGIAPHQEIDGLPGAYDYANNIGQFLEFFGSSSSPTVSEFRANYADHLIDTYVDNPKQQNYDVRDAAAHFATQILTDGKAPRELASTYLYDRFGGDSAGFRDFAQYAAQGGLYTSEPYLAHITETWRGDEKASQYAIDDPVIALAQAADGYRGWLPHHLVPPLNTEASHWLASELTGLAAKPPEQSNTHEPLVSGERLQAVTNTFLNHSDAVLDHFTTPSAADTNYQGSGLTQWQHNLDTFSGFLQKTMFGSEVIGGAAVQDAVTDYIDGQRQIVESGQNSGNEAEERIALLSATSVDAVRKIEGDIAAEKAEREELIGFTVDLALAALPLPSKANDVVKGALGDVFGKGAISTALQDFSGQLVDEATGRLTDEAKSWLTEQASPSEAELAEASTVLKGLTEATVGVYEQQAVNPNLSADLADDYQDIGTQFDIYNSWAEPRQ